MITLNAYTNGFNGSASSTGVGTPEYVRWEYRQDPWRGITLFEDGEMFAPGTPYVETRWSLGWLVEPRALRPENYTRAWDAREEFDAILTYDAELLARDPDKFILCPRMGVHVQRHLWGLHAEAKTRAVAMLTTGKCATPGHALRREVAERYGARGLIDVFGRDRWADKVTAFTPYRFAVVIESERAHNLFTDHLLDAIALGCVPLYHGAPNIGSFLDAGGILAWDTPRQLETLLRTIGERGAGLYAEMLPAMRRNLARLGEYRLVEDWMWTHVLRARYPELCDAGG